MDGNLVIDGDLFIPTGSMTSQVVQKVTSTDNAVVRFDGVTGQVQNSSVIIDDSGKMDLNKNSDIVGVLGRKSDSNIHLEIGALGAIDSTSQITMGWSTNRTYAPVAIVAQNKNGIGATYSDLVFATRNTNTDIAPTERMRIDSAGNVGVGVTPSAWSSGFNAIEGNSGSIVYRSSNSGLELWQNAYSSYGANAYKATAAASRYAQQGGQHTWFTAPSGTAGNAITWTNTMTLDTSGNLTVGNNSTMPVITAKYDASNYIYMQGRNTSDATEIFLNLIGGVKKSAILANGNFQSATNVYGSTSDIKLKEKIVDTSPKLEKLMKVQVRNFNYIGQEEKQIGVIAQEIEQVFPSVVFETKDTKQVEVTKTKDITDEDGNVTQEEYTEIETVETGEVTKNVKYSIIYMMMLKGMQEMRAEYTAEIESLKARIEILEGAK